MLRWFSYEHTHASHMNTDTDTFSSVVHGTREQICLFFPLREWQLAKNEKNNNDWWILIFFYFLHTHTFSFHLWNKHICWVRANFFFFLFKLHHLLWSSVIFFFLSLFWHFEIMDIFRFSLWSCLGIKRRNMMDLLVTMGTKKGQHHICIVEINCRVASDTISFVNKVGMRNFNVFLENKTV